RDRAPLAPLVRERPSAVVLEVSVPTGSPMPQYVELHGLTLARETSDHLAQDREAFVDLLVGGVEARHEADGARRDGVHDQPMVERRERDFPGLEPREVDRLEEPTRAHLAAGVRRDLPKPSLEPRA